MEESSSASSTPHVLIFPTPIQGHVNPMLKLLELLVFSTDFTITFVNSNHTHDRLLRYAGVASRFPHVRFLAVPDGLPEDHPRSGEAAMEIFGAMEKTTKSVFRDAVAKSQPPVDCIIGDGALGLVNDVAVELGINIILFRTSSACSFWAYFCIPNMIEAREIPIKDMDGSIKSVPGIDTFLRCRDLPSFCRAAEIDDPNLQLLAIRTQENSNSIGLIFNTFEDLEGPILSRIREKCQNVYSLGPIHLHAGTRSSVAAKEAAVNSLWEVDRSSIRWLDQQPEKSVIYVSFGSLTQVTKENLMEFWYGLVNSKQRFLWVIRAGSVGGIHDGEDLLCELAEQTGEMGRIVAWVPQEEVLAHPSVAAFLTHSGWNSTLESVSAGVPMICWPYFADQTLNSRYVEQIWRLGLDMKDVCCREVVEKMVNDVMVERKHEFAETASRIARLARESVCEGGSSYRNLDRLIGDIRGMCAQHPSVHMKV